MKKLNQKGFSIWELLLLLLVLLILAAVGYWVRQQRGENKPAGDATPAQNEKKEEKSQEKAKKYLEIKELGVKVELTEANADAYYLVKNDLPNTAYLSLESLKNADQCGADKVTIGAISKYKKTEVDERTGVTYEETAKQYGKVIGDYAYLIYSPQAACSDNQEVQSKADNARKAFVQNMMSIQAL